MDFDPNKFDYVSILEEALMFETSVIGRHNILDMSHKERVEFLLQEGFCLTDDDGNEYCRF